MVTGYVTVRNCALINLAVNECDAASTSPINAIHFCNVLVDLDDLPPSTMEASSSDSDVSTNVVGNSDSHSVPVMRRYLLICPQTHSSFRLPEIQAVVDLVGVKVR